MVRPDSRSNLGRAFASQSRHKKYEGVRREGDVSFTVGAGAGVSVGGKRMMARLWGSIYVDYIIPSGITGYSGIRSVFCPCKDESYK